MRAPAPADHADRKVQRLWYLALWSLLGVYVCARLWSIPADSALTGGFSHDSGYLSIVAARVRDGLGYTNPGHWMLFRNPPSLPMPYHNANPLYPTLMAVLSKASGMDVARAGFVISVLANALLAVSVFSLFRRFTNGIWFASLGAAVAALFPSNWIASLNAAPDSLCVALMFSAVALVVRARSGWHWAASGMVFGLAWLTRSTALVCLPGLAYWVYRRKAAREAIRAGLLFLAAAALVASPWLVRSALVWGSAFHDDGSYSWLQDYYARAFGGDVAKVFRSLTPPPSLVEIVRKDPFGLLLHALQGTPRLMYYLGAEIAAWSKPTAAALGALFLLTLPFLRIHWRTPEFRAGALVVSLTFLSLTVRGFSVESRYFAFSTTLLVLWMLAPLSRAWSPAARQGPPWMRGVALAWAVYFVFAGTQNIQAFRSSTEVSERNADYMRASRLLAARDAPGQTVIAEYPYFYSYFTGAPSTAPPYTDKVHLLQFMSKYSATYLLLPADRLDSFFQVPIEALAPEIRAVDRIGPFTLLRRMSGP